MVTTDSAPLRNFAIRLDLERKLEPFADLYWDGDSGELPTLHLDDVSAIPFLVDIAGVKEYQHRARVRARGRDLYVAVTPQTDGYEEYCRTRLRLGAPRFVLAEPVSGPLAVAVAAARGTAFAQLVEATRAAGGMLIHPYMGIEAVWDLARNLATEAGGRVAVLGPPPPVTWIANDKALFSEVVELALGPGWLVETHATADPAVMARLLVEISGRYEMVGLKRTRCASAMGNRVFLAADLATKDQASAQRNVRHFLKRTEWPEGEVVLVVAWEKTSLSPSTQLWIPPYGGPPLASTASMSKSWKVKHEYSSEAALRHCRRRSTTFWPAQRYGSRPSSRRSVIADAARSTISFSETLTASFGFCSPNAMGGGVARARQ